MRRRFQIGRGVNPSLIINKGIYIQHVDGGFIQKKIGLIKDIPMIYAME
jgi:hypothetical protein